MTPSTRPAKRSYAFISKLYGEMSRLFADRYFHVGGDEVNGAGLGRQPCGPAIQDTHGLADNQALQAYFTDRFANPRGRWQDHVGWDELLSPISARASSSSPGAARR